MFTKRTKRSINGFGISFHSTIRITALLFVFCGISLSYSNQFADSQSAVPIRWKSGKIKIALSESLISPLANGSSADYEFTNAIKRSLRTWETAGNIEFIESWSPEVSSARNRRSGDGINLITIAPTAENLSLFEENPFEVSARTKVYFNGKGFITEADIVLNPLVQFSTDGKYGTFDLESTVTHELGHLLGLDHSFVLGSIMNSHLARNGVINPTNSFARALTSDELFSIRSLYGLAVGGENCCGVLTGKIFSKGINQAFRVWLEESLTGNTVLGFITRNDGTFRIPNVAAGNYRIYTTDKNQTSFSQYLGDISIKPESNVNFVRSVKLKPKTFSIDFSGVNAQLSNVSVRLNPNTRTVIYVGGKNISAGNIAISFNSPYLSVDKTIILNHDFGSELSVISFEISVADFATPGNYSINFTSEDGEKTNLIGGITIVDNK